LLLPCSKNETLACTFLVPEFSFHRLLFVAYPLRWKREKAMKVAKQIALTIPPNVRAQPDRVIK
jgi:hypothetical protein